MAKILLLSDTHSYLDKSILKYVAQADEVWHAGDIGNFKVIQHLKKLKPLRAIYGNIDGVLLRRELTSSLRFKVEDVTVFMVHIGGFPGKYAKHLRDLIKNDPPNLLICGHSHILKVMYDKTLGFLYINPGAAGIEGFHTVRTMVRFEIDNKEIKNLEIIELGKKGSTI